MTNNINNNAGQNQACAVCKHQRKKCSDKCELAPFFPSEKSQQFQAVHKLFGVSNVLKLVRFHSTLEDKAKAVETLIWEAQWREKNPTLGCFGEYQKTLDENMILKKQLAMVHGTGGAHGWNSNNAVSGYNINSDNANNVIADHYELENIYFEDVVPSSVIPFPLAAAYPHGGRTNQRLQSPMVNYNFPSQQGYVPGQEQERRDMNAMNDGANGYTPSRGG